MIIFNKSSLEGQDRTLILENGENLVYPIEFDKWRHIKIGVSFSFAEKGSLNAIPWGLIDEGGGDGGEGEEAEPDPEELLIESLPITTERDWLRIGFKKNLDSDLSIGGTGDDYLLGIFSSGNIFEISRHFNSPNAGITYDCGFGETGIGNEGSNSRWQPPSNFFYLGINSFNASSSLYNRIMTFDVIIRNFNTSEQFLDFRARYTNETFFIYNEKAFMQQLYRPMPLSSNPRFIQPAPELPKCFIMGFPQNSSINLRIHRIMAIKIR